VPSAILLSVPMSGNARAIEEHLEPKPDTLGAVLYANKDKATPPESEWVELVRSIAAGDLCKILATDVEHDRVTMLVRLLPGASYPPHTHAGTEELHLLEGELWIDDRLLYPGDYNYGKPGGSDQRVYSETGCTCVLITSPSDALR
jgi:anti-sigma factor ChrR (cupin superfamily)